MLPSCYRPSAKVGLLGSMADTETDRANKPIGDLPFSITWEIMCSMDGDRGWRALAAECDFTMGAILLLELEERRQDGSPTRLLLMELSGKNLKVYNLGEKLAAAGRIREKQLLEEYVFSGKKSKQCENKCSLSSLARQPASSPGHFSLPAVLLKELPDQVACKTSGASSGSYSSSASEFNFNHSPHSHPVQSQVGGAKNYDNKVIPGTEQYKFGPPQPELGSMALSLPSTLPAQLNTSGSKPDRVRGGQQLPSRLVPREDLEPLPTTSLPSLQSISATSSPSSGANMLQRLLSPAQQERTNATPVPTQSPPPPGCQNTKSPTPSTHNSHMDEEAAMSMKISFSYAELEKATDGFSVEREIGKGAFGTVYLGQLKQMTCVVKRLNRNEKEKTSQLRELAALSKFQHENIVTLYGYTQDGPELCLVYQYLVNGSLEERLAVGIEAPPSWERRLNILVGACRGLNFLHTMGEKPLIHGDIKSANILLDCYLEAKLGDLGQAQYATSSSNNSGYTHITMQEVCSKLYITKAYSAPELLTGARFSISTDVFAMGVVFLEVCSGQKAMDINRTDNKFLHELFTNMSSQDWILQFQDRRSVGIPDELFISTLKLAKKCFTKNRRPKSGKLFTEIKNIYSKYLEKTKNEMSGSDSLSSSLWPQGSASDQSHSSCQSIVGSEQSCNMSHTCGPTMLDDALCAQEFSEYPHNSVQRLQEEKLREFQALHNSKRGVTVPCESSSPKLDTEVELRVNRKEELLKKSASPGSPDSPINSFPQGTPLPEAFRLQMAYDKDPRQKIERLSEVIVAKEDAPEDYPSDPEKLRKLMEWDGEQMPSRHENEGLKSMDLNEEIPQCDPKKLAQLQAFDKGDVADDKTSGNFQSMECELKKLVLQTNTDCQTGEESKNVLESTDGSALMSNDLSSEERNSGTRLRHRVPVRRQEEVDIQFNLGQEQEGFDYENRRQSDIDNNAPQLISTPQPAPEQCSKVGSKFSEFFNNYEVEKENLFYGESDEESVEESVQTSRAVK